MSTLAGIPKGSLAFRIITICFDILLFGTLARSLVLGPVFSNGGVDFWPVLGLVATAWSLVWTSVAIGLLFFSARANLRNRNPSHPAIDLSFDLVSWLLLFIFGAFMMAMATASESQSLCLSSWGYYDECQNGGIEKARVDVVSAVFLLVNGVIHLVFFGMGCHAVRLLNNGKQEGKLMQKKGYGSGEYKTSSETA